MKDENGTALLDCVPDRHHEFAKAILIQLKKGCCNDEQLLLTRLRQFGCTLFRVINLGNANVTRLMLTNGYSVDERDLQTNRTALHEAVSLGDFENVKVLIEFGASLGALNKDEFPPLYYLFDKQSDSKEDERKRVDIMKILIEHGALTCRPSDDFIPPLDYILRNGTLEAINTLMQYDVEYNSFDALHSLVCNGDDDSLEVLRGKIFDANAHISGFSLLMNAVSLGCIKKVNFLLERGADPNAVDLEDGTTPLTQAFTVIDSGLLKNLLAIVRLLLQYGADAQHVITNENQEQQTVFDIDNDTLLQEQSLESIVAHLALKEDCGVTISELIRRKIDSRDTFKERFQVCKKQIEEMKGTTINGSVTLYKLLTESHLKITRYASDPELALKFEDAMEDKRLLDPYYSISLKRRVGKAIRAAKLKEDVHIIFKMIFPCCFRNCHEIFDKILDYITWDDMKNVCKVYDLQESETFSLDTLYM